MSNIVKTLNSADRLAVVDGLSNKSKEINLGGVKEFVLAQSVAVKRRRMVTVAIGNSITKQSAWTSSGIPSRAEIHQANALCGGQVPMRFKMMTPADPTKCDRYGIYGYSQKRSDEILAEIQTQWLDPLDAAGIIPDLVIIHALFENDLIQGIDPVVILGNLTKLIRIIRAKWPGAFIELVCPRPSTSYNTAAKIAAYKTVRDFCLAMDDGIVFFTSRSDVYEDPANPGWPIMTPGSNWTNSDDGLHPSTKSTVALARVQAATKLRMAAVFICENKIISNNFVMTGSQAVSAGANQSGTMPLNVTVGNSGNVTKVCTAEDPGFLISHNSIAATAGPASLDLGFVQFASLSVSGSTQISPFATFEIVSGAENLRNIVLKPRITDGGGQQATSATLGLTDATTEKEPDWRNGDIYTVWHPPIIALSGALVSVSDYTYPQAKISGGGFEVRCLNHGVEIVA